MILRIIIRRCSTCRNLFGPVSRRDICETCLTASVSRRIKLQGR